MWVVARAFMLLQKIKYFYLINRLITISIFLQEIPYSLKFKKKIIEISRHRRSEINKNLNIF